MNNKEQIEDIQKTIDYLKGTTSEQYMNGIIGIICFEKGIEPTKSNLETLQNIYWKWFDSDYSLINDCFSDSEYDLFNRKERTVLGISTDGFEDADCCERDGV